MKQIVIIELNECWANWLEAYRPGVHPSLTVKDIVLRELDRFAVTRRMELPTVPEGQ